jgi:CubicO group peptidase (beta-lactamase class C family)
MTGSAPLPSLEELLTDWIGLRIFSPGVQVAVWYRGTELSHLAVGEDGLGRPVTDRTLFRVYCALKPVLAIVVARQVEAGKLGLDDSLAELLPDFACAADRRVTLRHLLQHTAGLHGPAGFRMELVEPSVRREVIAELPPPLDFPVGEAAAYSEFTAWNLIGWVLEKLTGAPVADLLRSEVIAPLDLCDTWLGMDHGSYGTLAERMGINVDLRSNEFVPLLGERLERIACECNPAYGGYTTGRDLARFYARLLEGLEGSVACPLPAPDTLHAFCSSTRGVMHDPVLGRECDFGLGFMTDLSLHGFGSACSEASFGHSGNIGASFGFADPVHELAVACVFNGVCDDYVARLRRASVLDALYEDLGIREASGSAALSD